MEKTNSTTKTCLLTAGIGCIIIIFLSLIAAAFFFISNSLSDKDRSTKTQNKTSSTSFTNTKYDYSFDLGDLKGEITEVENTDPEVASWYQDTFYYCLNNPDQSEPDPFCNKSGLTNIFTIHVLTQDQYNEVKNSPMSSLQELAQKDNLYFMFSHPNGYLPEKVRSDFLDNIISSFKLKGATQTTNHNPTDSNLTPEQQVKELLKTAKTYYNCTYKYTFEYPSSWACSDGTNSSDQVFTYGKGINITFTSYPASGLTLSQFSQQRISVTDGTPTQQQETQRQDSQGYLVAFENPDSASFYWLQANSFIEMTISGDNYSQENPEAYVVASTLQLNQDLAQCPQVYQQPTQAPIPTQPPPPPQQSAVDPANCTHPNGDVEYWWNNASQAEQDCFILKYPESPFLRQ